MALIESSKPVCWISRRPRLPVNDRPAQIATPSPSLQMRMSRGSVSLASGRSRPSLVVMSGTEMTNWIPLALISRMILSPESPATVRPGAAPAFIDISIPGCFGADASTGKMKGARCHRGAGNAVFRAVRANPGFSRHRTPHRLRCRLATREKANMAFRGHGLLCVPGVDILPDSKVGSKRRFQLVLVKPSHYDDDGYVIRWWRALIPSNSLAAVYGLALDCAQRQVLGPDVAIDIDVIDESNTRVNIPKLIRRFRKHGNFGLFGLVGVQSNQYPRALDIARSIRAANIPVAMGGFHVSGCLSMLDGSAIDLELARNLEISLFAGEAEGRLDAVLRDAAEGKLKPLYNYMDDLPGIGGTPIPFLPLEFVKRTAGTNTSFDAGRGCPFQCSFCTIINVQGRKSRFRSPDDIERIVRDNWAQNITRFFITDDNFARNKEWEAIFDRLAKLREVDKIPLGIMIQVDTMCHKIDGFIEKAKKAGVTRVFLGLENINPDNLAAAKKKQNKITEYRKMLLAWKAQGIFIYAGYIIGFPSDTPDSIRRDIEIIQRELPLDLLEFNILTPLPGSEDH